MRDQNFGIEIEMTCLTRAAAARIIAGHFDTDACHVGGGYDAYTVRDTTGRQWKVMSDASIRCQNGSSRTAGSQYSVEVVSPICQYGDIETIQEIVRKLRAGGAKVNSSCGIHVHVDASNHMASVMSTALSRLNSFLDTEMEQVLCFDTAVDAERFCQEKSAIFVVMPEENPNAYFMISLLIQQLYREILSVADENGGKLPNRVMFYCDEFGTMPPIQSAEMMYSASRSRRLSIVSIIQSYQQLEKNYGREGAAIIQDNCQITIVGGFAPTSETADIVSKTLGSRTVLTGSVSRSKNDPSQSLQMTERPLMSADELKNMKKGSFIVMKTGTHPFVSPLKLFFKWGISFSDMPYTVAEHGARKVCYVSRVKIMQAIASRFPQVKKPKTEANSGGTNLTEPQPKAPIQIRTD